MPSVHEMASLVHPLRGLPSTVPPTGPSVFDDPVGSLLVGDDESRFSLARVGRELRQRFRGPRQWGWQQRPALVCPWWHECGSVL